MAKYLKKEWWFRNSTNEWIFQLTLNKPDTVHGSYQYTGKTKFRCILSFIRYGWSFLSDYIKY